MKRGLSRFKATASSNGSPDNHSGTSPPKNHRTQSKTGNRMGPTSEAGLVLKVSILKVQNTRRALPPAGALQLSTPLSCLTFTLVSRTLGTLRTGPQHRGSPTRCCPCLSGEHKLTMHVTGPQPCRQRPLWHIRSGTDDFPSLEHCTAALSPPAYMSSTGYIRTRL